MPINLFKKKEDSQKNIETEDNKSILEKTEQLSKTDHSTKNLNYDAPSIIDINAKEKEIKGKKIRFKLITKVVTLFFMFLILAPMSVRFYKRYILKPDPIPQPPIEEKDPSVVDMNDPESIVEYKNDQLKLFLEHLRKASLFENTSQLDLTKKTEIIYDKNNPNENITLENLTEGYIFRVSAFSTTLRKIDDIARVKKEAFSISCPETAKLTDIVGTTVDGIEGRTFEVLNCGADYKVTYVVKNGLNYEFAQIFKGDIGYRQLYAAETENILRSISFYPDEVPDLGPIETYNSDEYKISFEYPRFLDKECCNINGPISNSSRVILTLAHPDTYVDENNLDVIGFFVDQYEKISFDTYIENQKNLLTDDYIVTKGEPPKPEIRTVAIGDREGTMLRGYSWKGNDLLYIDITKDSRHKKILAISIKNISGEDFDNIVKSIFESFIFY